MRHQAATRYGFFTTLENGLGSASTVTTPSDSLHIGLHIKRFWGYACLCSWILFHVGGCIRPLETFHLILASCVDDAARGPQGPQVAGKAGSQELTVPVASATLLREACANDACDIVRSSGRTHRPQGPRHTRPQLLPLIETFG
jgi:hypothetical protein